MGGGCGGWRGGCLTSDMPTGAVDAGCVLHTFPSQSISFLRERSPMHLYIFFFFLHDHYLFKLYKCMEKTNKQTSKNVDTERTGC